MKLTTSALAALSLVCGLQGFAQTNTTAAVPFPDPANLRGERISPKTGRELPIEQGALGLEQMLRKLNTRASLMLIVAHPDDEDGGMLTLYSRGEGARVATLTLTRGEGGQNAMTGDFEDALGLIRTQELLAADRYFGADQFFGTEVDFGFSKTKEESFRKWTHQRVLYDAVRAVRLYRPLVIAAVFIGGVTDGHGQHQVSGEIAQEVFKAAADPGVFPELTREGILPWAPLKVYGRVPSFAITDQGLFDYATNQYTPARFTNYVTGETTTSPPTPDVTIHEGQTDPLLTSAAANPTDLPTSADKTGGSLSYVQFARLGLGLQRSQIGPGARVAPSGAYDISYHRYGSRLQHQTASESGFFDGIDTTLSGIASLSSAPPSELQKGLKQLQEAVTQATRGFDRTRPEASASLLVSAQHRLGALLYALEQTDFQGKADVLHELRVKQVQLNDALVLALGVEFKAEANSPSADVLQSSSLAVRTSLAMPSNEPTGVYSEHLQAGLAEGKEDLLAINTEPHLSSNPLQKTLTAGPPMTSSLTRPYFFRNDIEQPIYQLRQPELRNAPMSPPALTAWATLRYKETEVQVARVVSHANQDVAISPAASVSIPARSQALTPGRPSVLVTVDVKPADTPVRLQSPEGWRVAELPRTTRERLQFQASPGQPPTRPSVLQALAQPEHGVVQSEGFRAVGYAGLPRTNFYTQASVRVVPVDLKLPERRRIAYVAGTGDAVADNLRSVGFEVTDLTPGDLTPQRLAHFDSVVLGVRTYHAHPELHGAPTEALLDYARKGGNVVVQYQTQEFSAADAPFALALGNAEKVVDESDPVQLESPDRQGIPASSPDRVLMYTALSYPNRITGFDFTGWVEERGHGFLQSWDPRYTTLTETHDPDQVPQRGGLITTSLGRGNWTYCAFALYRQLPEAVPGGFRLFVNLLGLADQGKS